MGHNKLYRYFIILQADKDNKNEVSSKQISGYAKIEAKGDRCKISFYIQNLESTEKYYMVLICYKKDNRKIINLGPIKIDDSLKGQCMKEYYINNIAGLNVNYEDISGAGIFKMVDDNMSFMLYGFNNSESVGDDWKKCKVCNYKEEEIPKDFVELKNKDNKKDKDKHNSSKFCEHKEKSHNCKDETECKQKKEHKESKSCKEKEVSKEVENKKDDIKCECKKIEPECEECLKCSRELKCNKELKCDRELKRNKFEEYEKEIEDRKDEKIDPYDFNLKGKLGEFFEKVVSDFTLLKDKYKEIKYCKWYKAQVSSIEDMCDTSNYNKYTIAYYPMINYYPYIKKYGYFVMGYKCDEKGNLKYIVYGVPGGKGKQNQPYGGRTGFVTWMQTENEKTGLWLMFYDYKKSMVVVPAKE